ncbi:radical SAM protein [Pectinatus sottacetonis]|uniref:radical SAM protein n=1 Tax=Pectinatus sottacetonis TaxID=1002795 RepID=UPI0018C45128|nr:radical SAM protein [Pectinatus sottacetonis]
MHEALYYHHEKNSIICDLCPHNCKINPGDTGLCHVRLNKQHKLYSLNYGMCSTLSIDPIEKKPLYKFFPQHNILSIGSWGCNLKCKFCQNYEISQKSPSVKYISSDTITKIALASGDNNLGLAFTYSEPLVCYEYVYDTAVMVHNTKLKTVLVTNGFLNSIPFKNLIKLFD